MSISNTPTTSNITENWLFDFTADNQNCLVFDGSDDYVDFGNILGTYTSFTLEAWIKPANVSGTKQLINRGIVGNTGSGDNTSFTFTLASDDIKVFWEYTTGGGTAGADESDQTVNDIISADTWTHVCVTRNNDDNKVRFYKNGALVRTSTSTNDPDGGGNSGLNLRIGATQSGSSFYNGKMAHVRIWNVTRTDGEIAHYYNRNVESSQTGLVGYWKMDEGYGSTLYDSSSNSNTGTINSATWGINEFTERIHAFGLAFRDTTIDNNFYYGSVLSKSLTVRDSIDLLSGQASTGNITVTSTNFSLHGKELYQTIYNGTSEFFNREVRVYAQLNDDSSLSNCQQIFTGRLVDVSLDNTTVSIVINSWRPWEQISIPNVQHTEKKVYEPLVYGSFNPGQLTGQYYAAYGGLYPVPLLDYSEGYNTDSGTTHAGTFNCLMPRSYVADDLSYIHWHVDDYFLPAYKSTSVFAEVEATTSEFGVNVLKTPITYKFGGYITPNVGTNQWSDNIMDNHSNAFARLADGTPDYTVFASKAVTGYNSHSDSMHVQCQTAAKEFHNSEVIETKTSIQAYGAANTQIYDIKIFKNGRDHSDNKVYDSEDDTGYNGFVPAASTFGDTQPPDSDIDIPTELVFRFDPESASGFAFSAHTLRCLSVQLRLEFDIVKHSSGTPEPADLRLLSRTKFLYAGGPGLTASWDNGAIVHGHDAHRDILQRFCGITSTDPDNWSSLDTDRTRNTANDADIDTWKIRFWQLKPAPVKKILDDLAYEFGFIYKISPGSGNVKYIHIKQASELSASVDLTGDDVKDVQLKTSGLDNVTTKMTINTNPSPATDKFYTTVDAENFAVRYKLNLDDKQGIETVDLQHNIGAIPTTPNSDCNADWYSYQNNIRGDLKIILTADVVNPVKGYGLETGDIVTFSDMPVEMFGEDFSSSKYFMITETRRTLGKVGITAREVG